MLQTVSPTNIQLNLAHLCRYHAKLSRYDSRGDKRNLGLSYFYVYTAMPNQQIDILSPFWCIKCNTISGYTTQTSLQVAYTQ